MDDSQRFLQFLFSVQNPLNCSTTRLYVWKGARYGFGAQLRVMANSMLEALSEQRTFVLSDVRTQWIGARVCEAQTWDCIFEQASACRVQDAFLNGVLPASPPPPAARGRVAAAAPLNGCSELTLNPRVGCDRVRVARTSCARFDAVRDTSVICMHRQGMSRPALDVRMEK
eukprot:649194-Pleurochrysis_carterae.AAC.2